MKETFAYEFIENLIVLPAAVLASHGKPAETVCCGYS